MATFTATLASDFRNLDIYKNIRSSVFIPDAANGGTGGFKAQFALTSWVQVKGFGFAYAPTPFGTVPYLGTATSTETYINGKLAYTVTGLSITQQQAGQYINMPAEKVRDIIFGKADTLIGSKFDDMLDGFGGGDTMKGGGGNDTYFVDSKADTVFELAGGGNLDTVKARVSYSLQAKQQIEVLSAANEKGKEKLSLTGNEFANTIKGNAGDNVINGGGASKAGAGADTLFGLGGKDTFVFDSAILTAKGAVIANNVAHLADFSVIDDAIKLSKSVFAGLTADSKGVLVADQFKDIGKVGAKLDGSDRVLYDSKSGALYYDKDGSGSAAAIKFATIDTFKTQVDSKGISTVSHLDFLIG